MNTFASSVIIEENSYNMTEAKEIHFYIDNSYVPLKSYEETAQAIKVGQKQIHTTSLANLDQNLRKQGYTIYLHKGTSKAVVTEKGDLLTLFIQGKLNFKFI